MRLTAMGDTQRIIRRFSLATLGRFKTAWRGEFDLEGLQSIILTANRKRDGLPAFLQHSQLTGDDRSEYFLGMVKGVRFADEAHDAVVGDLHLSSAAAVGPFNAAEWLTRVARESPQAVETSLVITPERKIRVDAGGKRILGADNEPLPPLWFAKELHSIDVVRIGESSRGVVLAKNRDVVLCKAIRRNAESRRAFAHTQWLGGAMRLQVVPKKDEKRERLVV